MQLHSGHERANLVSAQCTDETDMKLGERLLFHLFECGFDHVLREQASSRLAEIQERSRARSNQAPRPENTAFAGNCEVSATEPGVITSRGRG